QEGDGEERDDEYGQHPAGTTGLEDAHVARVGAVEFAAEHGSNPLDPDSSEEAVGPDHQNQHQRHERGNLLDPSAEDRVQVASGKVLQHADEQPAEDGSAHAVEPADDHHRQDLEPEDGQRPVDAAAHGGEQHAAKGGDDGGDAPGEREDSADGDAHGERNLLGGRSGAHGDAGAGVLEEQREGDQQDGDGGRAVQVAPRYRQGADLDRRQREDLVHRPRVGAPDALHDGAQDAGAPERHHDHRDDRLADQRAQHDPLQRETEQRRESEGEQQRG